MLCYALIQDKVNGELAFENVAFSYPTRENVDIFKNLSFSVKPGQTLAIVGPSGSGKSTVTALIERFYDPTQGAVVRIKRSTSNQCYCNCIMYEQKLDGTNIKILRIQWLRQQIGLVSQEPALFDMTIADNIRYGANFKEVTSEEVEQAAKSANIHDFIMSLPQVGILMIQYQP